MSQAKKVWTEAELEAHELIDGELVMKPKNNFFHGRICIWLSAALERHATERCLGAVLDSNMGFWMFNRNYRAPDISFLAKERMLNLGFKPSSRKFFPGAPDLAVEIVSASNARADIDARLKDFFSSGTQTAWLINPDEECVEICHSPADRNLIGAGGFLDGEHLLPSFQFPIAALFKEWDWD